MPLYLIRPYGVPALFAYRDPILAQIIKLLGCLGCYDDLRLLSAVCCLLSVRCSLRWYSDAKKHVFFPLPTLDRPALALVKLSDSSCFALQSLALPPIYSLTLDLPGDRTPLPPLRSGHFYSIKINPNLP